MFCGLGEEERTKIRKKKKGKKRKKKEKKRKKKEKKEINLIAAKRGLVGMKGYLETYNLWNIFSRTSAVFDWDRFLRQTCGGVLGF